MLAQERPIVHYLYTAWPDHGVPNTTLEILAFRKAVAKTVITAGQEGAGSQKVCIAVGRCPGHPDGMGMCNEFAGDLWGGGCYIVNKYLTYLAFTCSPGHLCCPWCCFCTCSRKTPLKAGACLGQVDG